MSKGSEEKGTVPWQGIWTLSCKMLTVLWNRESEILREAVRAIGSENEEEGAYLKHCRGRICTTLWEWESRKESRMTLNSGFGTCVLEVPFSEWKKREGAWLIKEGSTTGEDSLCLCWIRRLGGTSGGNAQWSLWLEKSSESLVRFSRQTFIVYLLYASYCVQQDVCARDTGVRASNL